MNDIFKLWNGPAAPSSILDLDPRNPLMTGHNQNLTPLSASGSLESRLETAFGDTACSVRRFVRQMAISHLQICTSLVIGKWAMAEDMARSYKSLSTSKTQLLAMSFLSLFLRSIEALSRVRGVPFRKLPYYIVVRMALTGVDSSGAGFTYRH